MHLIISQEALKITELQHEIEALKSTVTEVASDNSFKERNEKMMANINQLEMSIMRIKKVKYECDTNVIC